jgi:hypothetical protein
MAGMKRAARRGGHDMDNVAGIVIGKGEERAARWQEGKGFQEGRRGQGCMKAGGHWTARRNEKKGLQERRRGTCKTDERLKLQEGELQE